MPILLVGCTHISSEPSLPPIDFCTVYPINGIPSVEEPEDLKLIIDQLNAIYLIKCLHINPDDLPDPDITDMGNLQMYKGEYQWVVKNLQTKTFIKQMTYILKQEEILVLRLRYLISEDHQYVRGKRKEKSY